MSYRDHCGLCGESYDDENLETCQTCHRSFCYRCGSFGEKRCRSCIERQGAPASRRAERPQEDAGMPEGQSGSE
jgi:hypothetical protein